MMRIGNAGAARAWVVRAVVVMAFATAALPARAADPDAGRATFRSACSLCHSDQPGVTKTGPTLFGLVGRKTGAVPGYAYSVGNQNANLTWDAATLDKYLESPRTVVPGTKMTYAGLKDPTKRLDLIAYLSTLK
jgi:cytochrome c